MRPEYREKFGQNFGRLQRDWATFAIHQGGHDTPEVRTRLWRALDDPCPEVRGEAAWSLGIFGERSLIPRLETLLREDRAISPNYFEAAEALGDPSLLPAVLEGAERWRRTMEGGEELHFCISSAIEALEEAVAAKRTSERSTSGVESNPETKSSSGEPELV
jgi:hypothetical protein